MGCHPPVRPENLKQRTNFVKCLIPQRTRMAGRNQTKRWLLGALLLCAAVQPSCGPVAGLNSGGSARYQIPFPDEAGAYRLREIEIPGFTDPSGLRGAFAEILVDPYESNGGIGSSTPVGRFLKTSSGLMVPTDYVSRVATSIQAHAERLYSLDAAAGVQQNLINWPVKIGIEANVVNSKDQSVVRNNALFDRRLNALLLVPYSSGRVPIGMNAGILGHEHFHRIFEAIVLAKLPSLRKVETRSVSEFNETVLRGMNEGFADFWAWVYTGDPDFIGVSLPNELDRRSLKIQSSELMSKETVGRKLNEIGFRGVGKRDKARLSIAYEAGTLYGRFLRDLTLTAFGNARADRIHGARLLVQVLPAILEATQTAEEQGERLDPLVVVKPLQTALEISSPSICRIFEKASTMKEECK